MALVLRDSLSGALHAVRPRPGRPATLYVCGPTVYDATHVGHGRTFLLFDLMRRSLEDSGVPVRHVMNITDFEDKIDARAARLGIRWSTLARREEVAFFRDLDALGVLPPTFAPRASSFVPEMTRVARALEATGQVRRQGDGWYFVPRDDPAHRNFPVGTALAEHAVEEPGHPLPGSPENRSFLVWKLQENGGASWDGPWGRGVPGWHLECYAMAEKYLGLPVDLHGGGADLIFPHHVAENDISFALRDTAFSRTFYHTGFVLLGGRKMSKSVGNLVSLREATGIAGPSALRWYLFSPAPNARLAWDEGCLVKAADEFERVRSSVQAMLRPGAGGRVEGRALERLGREIALDLSRGFHPDRAIQRLRAWAEGVAASPAGRLRRGELRTARAALRRIERLTGLALL